MHFKHAQAHVGIEKNDGERMGVTRPEELPLECRLLVPWKKKTGQEQDIIHFETVEGKKNNGIALAVPFSTNLQRPALTSE